MIANSQAYNVIDKFKHLTIEEIKQEIKQTSFPYAVCLDNIKSEYNAGTIIRNANAFGVRDVFYYGKKHLNRVGALGSYHYTQVTYLNSFEELKQLKDKYTLIGAETNMGESLNIIKEWPNNSLFCFGSEDKGLCYDVLELCDQFIKINMFGSIRSVNVGVISGIVMNHIANYFNSIIDK